MKLIMVFFFNYVKDFEYKRKKRYWFGISSFGEGV